MKQIPSERRYEMQMCGNCARSLPEERDPVTIAAKVRNVLPYPRQRHQLILEALVARQQRVADGGEPEAA